LYIDPTGDELDKASIGLGLSPLDNFYGNPSLSVSGLKEWMMDIFYHPSRYVEVIRYFIAKLSSNLIIIR
jgi:hypothetical protein